MIFRRTKKDDPQVKETILSVEPFPPPKGAVAPNLPPQGTAIADTLARPPRIESSRRMTNYSGAPAPTSSAVSRLGMTVQATPRAAVPALSRQELGGKRLTVGKEINLSGEINSCDILTVEGRVDASLIGAQVIEVAEGGLFKGNAEIDVAEIAGIYEGDLTVRDKLVVRATGRIQGRIRYNRLVVDLGGVVIGAMEQIETKDLPQS